jgi:hypothetical protein
MRTALLISSSLRLALAVGGAGDGLAQTVGPVMNAPQFVNPQYPEVGIGVYVAPPASTSTTGDTSSGDGSSGSTSAASGSALSTLESEEYGSAAVADARNLNEDPNALADFASVESNFQNIGDTSGTSSATGPWQVTQGTFNYINQEYGLGLSASDITNPTDEAEVAAYTIDNYAQQVETATGAPPTVVQTYGAYEFGPGYGSQIATAPATEPLSDIVPASFLSNNNIPASTTVGQYYTEESAKLGTTASNSVFG